MRPWSAPSRGHPAPMPKALTGSSRTCTPAGTQNVLHRRATRPVCHRSAGIDGPAGVRIESWTVPNRRPAAASLIERPQRMGRSAPTSSATLAVAWLIGWGSPRTHGSWTWLRHWCSSRAGRRSGGRGSGVGRGLSEPMLHTAHVGAAGARLGLRAVVACMDAQQLAVRTESFDVVVSTFALGSLSDPQSALAECRRVTRPEAAGPRSLTAGGGKAMTLGMAQ